MEMKPYLDQAVELLKEELGDNLAGIYLHGSLAMGCFHPETSDIDLLIVVHDKLTREVSRKLAGRVTVFHDSLPNKRGIELSVVLKVYLKDFEYPVPFEFHFSDAHLERYKADENYLCGGFGDADLAAHFTIIYHRGQTLYGEPVREAFAPVDRQYYLHSILGDIEDAPQNIASNLVYYTLNLCRVLSYIREERVCSKQEGGEWGLQHVPARYHELLQRCLDQYGGVSGGAGSRAAGDVSGGAGDDPVLLADFAAYMISEIRSGGADR
ncbi:aminoglycoside adenylyltransferase domain-containing protein [Paenibacillus sp. MMS20-IR301]|uniref:aminoglycoside adenylyltransferase domain-containing protein n=1 Tax=Paenibacillus sp. MMS20-IR301 TaxID=2895946 RepID=UPI0028EA0C31|nr:aminoglycoside adenylyltransferase domain-containing protein [Paenibacillus sp. MMS20-IR301]WNS46026.1 DUF4111 domain-containing protein [Paenibacillus sp. MMS20-IR301]